MKIAPIINTLKSKNLENFRYRFIHTGQHYDDNMSDSFIKQLGIPMPDINFDIKGGTHSQQTAEIMIAYEKVLRTNLIYV